MKLGACYYPEQWERARWRDDARRMAAMGLQIVRIAEFAWALMEPREGEYDWAWLDEAVDTLADAGLQVVLGTPTAAPPRWLTERYPEVLAVDAQGRQRLAGSRRHVCFSSEKYFSASQAIVAAMARRYGQHPAVTAWQTDNEYGCHDTVLSYSPGALKRFRQWLQRRYGTIGALNERWGNVFWSMSCDSFEQVNLPVGLPAQANPIHALDWRRFAADEVLRFNRMQVALIREHAPGRDVLHNFMGFFGEFDHHEMGRDLDLATWDSYPLGHTDSTAFIDPQDRQRWARSGHPDSAPFHHDLYRGVGRGRFGVMEQQAGPVNWAPWNPSPQPGQIRLWTWEAYAHGAEFVSYFRWRQLPYAQEQMHSGLHESDDRLSPGGIEAAQVAKELPVAFALAGDGEPAPARVALVLDYASHWMLEIQRQGADQSYFGDAFALYGAARRLGLDVDIVGPDAALDDRALVLVPAMLAASDAFARRLAATPAQVIVGARSGSKNEDFRIADGLPPGPLARATGLRVRSVESLRPGVSLQVSGARFKGEARAWREFVEADADTEVLARFDDGGAAVLKRGRVRYLAASFEPALLDDIVEAAARDAGLAPVRLPVGLRLRRRGRLQFAFHSGPGRVSVPAPAGASWVVGGRELDPAGVACWIVD